MNKIKWTMTLALALILCLSVLAGCSGTAESPAGGDASQGTSDTAEPDDATTDEDQGDQRADKVLLVVSFGTSYNESRDATIGAVENRLQQSYPDYEVRRAFTSEIIIGILAEREGLEIDDVTGAMERLVADGVTEVVIQPTHVMHGYEYGDMVEEVTPYRDRFERFAIGEPLLSSDEDFERVMNVLLSETASYNDQETAVVFMGHGTEHEANAVYARLQDHFTEAGHGNYFVGTVEAEPELEEVMALVEATGATRVVLLPLMVVAGDHATNDMAGDSEDSWKSEFETAGYEVECVLKGLGQYPGIQELYVDHVADALG